MILVSKQDVYAFVIGGAVLGGGGGGSIKEGLELGTLATEIDTVRIVQPDEIEEDKTVVTVSDVGIQSNGKTEKEQYVRSVELLKIYGINVEGLIPSECGAIGSVNGWIQSTILKIPVLDSPCDGRAHPTGLMGSMGLHRLREFVSIQAAVGKRIVDTFSEILVKGELESVSKIVRAFSTISGGSAAVARNPINARYVIQNGAPGALTLCKKIGDSILEENKPYNKIKAAMRPIRGTIICEGIVTKKILKNKEGFDVGIIEIEDSTEAKCRISFVNEYMTLDIQEKRLAVFPDLINVFNLKTGLPVNSAEVKLKDSVAVTKVSRENLLLGSGLKYPEVYEPVRVLLEPEIGPISFTQP